MMCTAQGLLRVRESTFDPLDAAALLTRGEPWRPAAACHRATPAERAAAVFGQAAWDEGERVAAEMAAAAHAAADAAAWLPCSLPQARRSLPLALPLYCDHIYFAAAVFHCQDH